MTPQLRPVIVVLLFKIDWRKLFFVCSIFTIGSLLFQISRLPYPLASRMYSSPVVISSHKTVNGARHHEENNYVASEAVVVTSVISLLNSSSELNLSLPIVEKRESVSKNRRQRKLVKPKRLITSPPPNFPSHLQRYIQSLTPDEALVYAKREIENAPLVSDDPDLYSPLFRNVSIFKRSYELMELILKVYIYQDGDGPIFHSPLTKGIYASEGWFMKQMENNKYFVTKDPKKAHLFYLPYSAKQLELALHKPGKSSIKQISIFLRDYVNMLATKYPFWNRTRGKDHFLVACHDWGSYTLVGHEELFKNTIKALCNADVSEGVFVAGHDVSLPETLIRSPRMPHRSVGGKKVSQRPILAFFAGGMHGRVRPQLLKYWRDKDEDMRIYGLLPKRASRVMSYPEHMKSSKYCICPMGYEVNSPRIVESFYYECVPVIIANNFVPPLNEVLEWSQFSVIVAEKDIPKLKEILLSIPRKRYLMMQKNVKLLQKHFLWNRKPIRYDLFHMILHSIWFSRLNQIQMPQSS